MKKLRCAQMSGMTVQEVLDEFNERAEEFGISESDIVSISTSPPTLGVKLATEKGAEAPKVEVSIIYWSVD